MNRDAGLEKKDLGKLVRLERGEEGGFYKLVKYRPDHWGATGHFGKEGFEVKADTPEEAVELMFNELRKRSDVKASKRGNG